MSDTNSTEQPQVDLSTISAELRQVIEFDDIPDGMHYMITSIHEVSEEAVREAWSELPNSAQNVLDNFEQFHALVSVSQAFAGISVMEEFPTLKLPEEMDEQQQEAYRAQLLDQVLQNSVKDMVKQIKKARRDPILKRDFTDVFTR
ncbi:DUF3069 domain-containing protein [Vibrio ostreicida]|uniref:DUF3069 domain-containing protein n=1 Tax=Vibrio ostreicida TaxID=526588 RepID=A0ABT8BX98_9VIBR|nr:DUF3069 domain-containing protein [Vibrio ostreicida]MDN3611671.1 DUF3069 domain-containing protein [Vibrio ostreicida]NPD10130.1 DUF3069 domain-containing protein [Vibrio ostreicida]